MKIDPRVTEVVKIGRFSIWLRADGTLTVYPDSEYASIDVGALHPNAVTLKSVGHLEPTAERSPPVREKPHKGTLNAWLKIPCGSGLGYYIQGIFDGHPDFDKSIGHTSWVEKHEGNEIETRNSRYTLGTPFAEVLSKKD